MFDLENEISLKYLNSVIIDQFLPMILEFFPENCTILVPAQLFPAHEGKDLDYKVYRIDPNSTSYRMPAEASAFFLRVKILSDVDFITLFATIPVYDIHMNQLIARSVYTKTEVRK